MSNLEGMVKTIEENAKSQAEAIIAEAKENVAMQTEEAVKKTTEEKQAIIEKAQKEAERIRERVFASEELKVRDSVLRAKQKVVDEVFLKAKEGLRNLPEDKFIKFVEKSLKGLKLSGNEKIMVPKKYEKIKLDISLPIEASDRVSSGFLVEGESSTLNFSFEDLLDFSREDLEKEVLAQIFGA